MPPARSQRNPSRHTPLFRSYTSSLQPPALRLDTHNPLQSRQILELFSTRTFHQRLSQSTYDDTPLLANWTQCYDIVTRNQEILDPTIAIIEGSLHLLRRAQESFQDMRRFALTELLETAPQELFAPLVIDLTTEDDIIDLTKDLADQVPRPPLHSVGTQVPERKELINRLSEPIRLQSPIQLQEDQEYRVNTAPPSPTYSPKVDNNPFTSMSLDPKECTQHSAVDHHYNLAASTCEFYTCSYCNIRAPGHTIIGCPKYTCPSCGQHDGHDDECASNRIAQQRVTKRNPPANN